MLVENVSLEDSRKLNRSLSGGVSIDDSVITKYAKRAIVVQWFPDIMELNFYQFLLRFKIVKDIEPRSEEAQQKTVFRFLQRYTPNPSNALHHKYCRYELKKYKPWADDFSTCLDGFPDTDQGWIQCYNHFMETADPGLFPEWTRNVENAEIAAEESDESASSDEEAEAPPQEELEPWQQNQTAAPQIRVIADSNHDADSVEYWAKDRELFWNELNILPFWIENQKRNQVPDVRADATIDLAQLNSDQRLANQIFDQFRETGDQLLMRLEGEGG